MRILVESGGADKNAKTIGGATLFMLAAGVGAERGARTQKDALEAARLALAMGGGDINARLTEIAADGFSIHGFRAGRVRARKTAERHCMPLPIWAGLI